MKTHSVLLEATKTVSIDADSEAKAAMDALLRNPGWRVVAVDDTDVTGYCADCGAVVMDGDAYIAGDDMVLLCQPCAKTTEEIRDRGPLADCIDPPRGSFAGAPGDQTYQQKARW